MMSIMNFTVPRWTRLWAIFLVMGLCSGCTSSRLTNVWRDPEFKLPAMKNMFVIAAKNNPATRRLWEDAIVTALSGKGVQSIPSYRLFADSIPTPDQVGAAVEANKFDGVLFTRRLPTQISTTYIPGVVKTVQVAQFDERTQTYSTYYREVREPGVTDTNRIARHEVSVFATDRPGGHLVWAGTGELIDPSSGEEVRSEMTGLIIPELAHEGLIPANSPAN